MNYNEQDNHEREELERQELLRQMAASSVQSPADARTQGEQAAPPATPATPEQAATPDYTTLGQYGDKLRGYDMEKFKRPYEQLTEKYKLGLVQSHFNPLQGVSPEFAAAAKSLGIADFSGSGDKLTVSNPKNGERVRYGSGGTSDVVFGLKGQNADTAWQAWTDPSLEGSAPGPDGAQGGGAQGPSSYGSVQALTQQSTYDRLVAQLQQMLGPASTDRNALMQLLGGKK